MYQGFWLLANEFEGWTISRAKASSITLWVTTLAMDMNGSGTYRVKDVRNMLDDFFLPKDEVATRWLPHLPIKLNVFAWRLYLDRLPTKSNLIRRGIQFGSPICPNCISYDEDVPYIFFKCPLAIVVSRAVCRW
ncbi:RNA-directed DNA polymerase, eukaryota [Tanacetum coccineum]